MKLVFLVEGDRSLRQALARVLDAEGLAVRPCERVEELLRVVPCTTPACAVVGFAGARGWSPELRRALAGVASSIPIIAIDGSDEAGVRRIARRIGAQAYFRSPIDGTALVDAVLWALRTGPTGPSGRSGGTCAH